METPKVADNKVALEDVDHDKDKMKKFNRILSQMVSL